MTRTTIRYMEWLYGQMESVFSRSQSYRFKLSDLGIGEEKVRFLPAAIDTGKFSAANVDPAIFKRIGVREPLTLFYAGRVSTEKNLPVLAEVFKRLCLMRKDVALVVAGDGPYLPEMRKALDGLPAHFLGFQDDRQLVPLYTAASLFVFPSRTDTLGQVVMESLACGLPAVVTNEGGPKELVEDEVSGLVIASDDVRVWVDEIDRLLGDPARLQRMARGARGRSERFSLDAMFEAFWEGHVNAVAAANAADEEAVAPTVPAARH